MKNLLFFIGIGVILGAIGSDEVGTIEFAQAVKQCLVGLPMIALGAR